MSQISGQENPVAGNPVENPVDNEPAEWYTDDYENVGDFANFIKHVQCAQSPTILHEHYRHEECQGNCEFWYIEEEEL